MRTLLLSAALVLSACSAPISSVPPAPPALPPAPPALPATPPAGSSGTSSSVSDPGAVEAGVRAILEAQVLAWNSGDIRGFMQGYARKDSLTFLSGGTVRRGWEEAYYGYVRAYPDQATMGVLTFSDLVIRPISDDAALVWGRWHLQRTADRPGGLFTLLFRDTADGWRVIHDHTSSE